jgi:hypothetical protein
LLFQVVRPFRVWIPCRCDGPALVATRDFTQRAPGQQESGFGIGLLAAQHKPSVSSIAKPSQMKTMLAIMP